MHHVLMTTHNLFTKVIAPYDLQNPHQYRIYVFEHTFSNSFNGIKIKLATFNYQDVKIWLPFFFCDDPQISERVKAFGDIRKFSKK